MDDRWDRRFKLIWQINGVLLLVITSLGAIGLAVLFVAVLSDFAEGKSSPKLSEIAGAVLESEDLELGAFHVVQGTEYLVASLNAPSGSRRIASGSYGKRAEARNLLFYDAKSHKARWLFPGNDQLIRSHSFLFDPPRPDRYDEGGSHSVVALLLEVEERTHGDEAPASRRVLLAGPDGSVPTSLIEGADEVLGHHHIALGQLLIFYVRGGVARILEVDPTTRAVLIESDLEVMR